MGTDVIKVKNSANLTKIELNDKGDYAVISIDDDTLFDRFASGYKHITGEAEKLDEKFAEINKKYDEQDEFSAEIDKAVEKIRIKRAFSEETAKVIDGIFGADTVKKLFCDIYEEIPDFVPSAELFITFLEQVTPEMEKIFNRNIEERDKASKARMAKYQPRDHQKPQKKGASK